MSMRSGAPFYEKPSPPGTALPCAFKKSRMRAAATIGIGGDAGRQR